MPRPVQHTTPYPYSDTLFHRALGTREYWERRIREIDGPDAELAAFEVTPDRTLVTVNTVIPASALPGPAATFRPNGVRYRYTETWSEPADGIARGRMQGQVEGMTIALEADLLVRRTDSGCEFSMSGSIGARVPLIGRLIEADMSKTFVRTAAAIDEFTMKWLENAA
ncbi:DUF2505 domain-containing protein [Nocardia sp. NBC_01503]|uniref:DUF2505 domain-containing protein n=1 Tax=Nocardia sp. NBC_01503 TaxID=2975997 RepID=UPI002E7AFF06|nr:DUF2505 domain-containing protein [Nocardia sp. NBC_01503]WTL32081.1 DUF2505 domain-containing protein [Nocardia sp. NBC_01503]